MAGSYKESQPSPARQDRVFLLHLGGKIAIQNKVPLVTRDALSMAHTPGVARVCEAIAQCITPRELSAEYIVPSVFNR